MNLSESAYVVNPNVDKHDFCDALAVDKKWKSELQRTFARRVSEEMQSRQLSGNALAKIAKKQGHRLGQPTISRILDGKQDPGLEKVQAIAEALGVPAWYLQTEAKGVEERVIRSPALPQKVVRLGSPYPSVFTKREKQDESVNKRRTAAKKKRP